MTSTVDSTDNGPVLTLSPPQLSHLLFPAWTKTPPSPTKWSQTALSPIDIYTRRLLFCCLARNVAAIFCRGQLACKLTQGRWSCGCSGLKALQRLYFSTHVTESFVYSRVYDRRGVPKKVLFPCYLESRWFGRKRR